MSSRSRISDIIRTAMFEYRGVDSVNYSNANNWIIRTLPFAGNTDDLIEWGALHERLRHSPPPVSDAERCQLLLQLANGEPITSKQWNQLTGVTTLRASARTTLTISDVQCKGIADALAMRVANEHTKLIKNLGSLVSRTVALVPIASQGAPRFTVVARNAQGAFAYALWLLVDPAQPFGDLLCRCRHKPCGGFFLYEQTRPGPPRRKYCCDEHRKAADDANAATRMKDLRRDRNEKTTTRKPK